MGIRSITQIPGICAAHTTNEAAGTGCTVIVCPEGATGAVDVRGGAPATRETDLLRPEETVQALHAVVLSGGSAFGLAAASGVADELERHGIGVDVGVTRVPIVSGACLFDLMCGSSEVRPTAEDGVLAVEAALATKESGIALEQGNVGAGTGCTVGKIMGPEHAMKSGFGEAVCEAGSLVVGAVSAVNAVGDVYDPAGARPIAGVLTGDGKLGANSTEILLDMASGVEFIRSNTTISCIVTNARLTKAEATKVAQMSADAYAHTIFPTHTTNDGDTIFVMATGKVEANVDVVGALATKALEQAIVNACVYAESAYGFTAACDL